MAIPLDFLDLVAQELTVPHGLRVVVGHVDHGGHTARRRRARGMTEALLVCLASRVHLAVDDARQDPEAVRIVGLARPGRGSLSRQRDLAAGHGQEPILDDALREHQITGHHQIEIRHDQPSRRRPSVGIVTPMSPGSGAAGFNQAPPALTRRRRL